MKRVHFGLELAEPLIQKQIALDQPREFFVSQLGGFFLEQIYFCSARASGKQQRYQRKDSQPENGFLRHWKLISYLQRTFPGHDDAESGRRPSRISFWR